jgi:hypothetical protein
LSESIDGAEPQTFEINKRNKRQTTNTLILRSRPHFEGIFIFPPGVSPVNMVRHIVPYC